MWATNLNTENKLEIISLELSGMLSSELKMAGMLVLEEVYTNVKKYGYEKEDQEAYLFVFLVKEEDSNVLAFLDYGKEFDPTSFVLEEPDCKQVGGHGIRLVREFSKEMKYRRTADGANVLEITL